MGRPKLKVTKLPVKLTLTPALRAEAEALAYEHSESLSGMVERLLADEIIRQADAHRTAHQTEDALAATVRARAKAIAPLVDRIRKANAKQK